MRLWNSLLTQIALGLVGALCMSMAHSVLAQDPLSYDYTLKARNLQPADYGIDAATWEQALRYCNSRLASNESDLEARLLRAVGYRELGIRRALLLRQRDWKRSTNDFEIILQQDSLFRDALLQYARLKRYQGEFDQAFALMHRQMDLKGPSPHGMASLLRLYRQFIVEQPSDEVNARLDRHPSDYAAFATGELLRTKDQPAQADRVYLDLLRSATTLRVQPIWLARARVSYASDRPGNGQDYVMEAIEAIEDGLDARLVLEDFKYILTDAELDEYLELDRARATGTAYRAFFIRLLDRRNPLRAEDLDLRLEEHYTRLLHAEAQFAQYGAREASRVIRNTQPYNTAYRDFPAAYWLNGELGDRGLIYVRHGEPDDKALSVSDKTPFIESWRYWDPALTFHFEGHSGLGVLIPVLPLDLDVLEAREIWGGVYVRLTRALRDKQRHRSTSRRRENDLDLFSYNNELFDQSLDDVYDGLSSDRYEWPETIQHIDIPYMVAAFRGEEDGTAIDSTVVDVHFAIPLGQIARDMETVSGRLTLDVGLAVHDTLWNRVHATLESRSAPATDDPTAGALDLVRFTARPDTYYVNLHVGIDEANRMGSYQFGYQVPDFSSDELAISDIVPATQVRPTTEEGRYIKNGLYIQAHPTGSFDKQIPLHIYFEIYNLTFSSEDATTYTITYAFQEDPQHRKRRWFRRRRDNAFSVSFDRAGEERSTVEYGELDVREVDEGTYTLEVTVTDRNTGRSVSASRTIEIDDARSTH